MAKSRSRSPKAGKNAARPAARKAAAPRAAGLLSRAAPAARLPGGVQRKIAVGPADDSYEREADAVADRVMSHEQAPTISRIPASGLPAQREMAEVEDKPEEKSQEPAPAEKNPAEEAPKTPGPATGETTEKGPEDEEGQTLQRAEAAKEGEEKKDDKERGDAEEAQTLQREGGDEEEEAMQTLQRAEGEKEEEGAPEDKAAGEEKKGDEEEAAQAMAQRKEAAEEDKTVEGEEEKKAQTLQREAKGGEEATDEKKDEKKDEKPEKVQAKSRTNQDSGTTVADEAVREKGGGESLDPHVQRSLESSMNTDLSDVRVHRGQRAEQATDALNARAFTHGQDIWLGKGESARDTHLMAHEAAHVVQQGAGVQRSVVQRAGTGGGSAAAVFENKDKTIKLDPAAKTLDIPEMSLPDTANKREGIPQPFEVGEATERGDQLSKWRKAIGPAGLYTQVDALLPDSKAVVTPSGKQNFYLRVASSGKLLAGTKRRLKSDLRRPDWTEAGGEMSYDVDHIKELQLGGDDKETNYQLLDSSSNRSSGSQIKNERESRASAAHTALQVDNPGEKIPSPAGYKLKVARIAAKALKLSGTSTAYKFNDVAGGVLLKPLHVMSKQEVDAAPELQGDPSKLKILLGGKTIDIPWAVGKTDKTLRRKDFEGMKGFDATGITYNVGSGGALTGRIAERVPVISGQDVSIGLDELAAPYSVQADTSAVDALKDKLIAQGMSPVHLESTDLTLGGFEAHGYIEPSVKLFRGGTQIDLSIIGNEIEMSKTFSAGDFDFPGPIKVTDAGLTVSAGTAGLKAQGDVGFEIERVGKGKVTGIGDISGGFGVKGSFDFDKELFGGSDAKIAVRYESAGDTGKFSGEGTLKIPPDRVKGIKSATLAVTVDGEIWKADGTVEPKVPGVKEGKLGVKFDPKGGLEITGSLQFGEGIPRLKGGQLKATVVKGDEGWSVEGKGNAELDIPGAEASVEAEYKNGIFKAEAKLGYEKGIAKGSITAGVTNMPVGDGAGGGAGGGAAAGGAAGGGAGGDNLTVYGQGSVTIQFTPWLEGTAGIKIAPDGKMTVTGEVALPDSVEVFPQKQIEKKLLSVGVDIPIVGVAVAGQRIGIFLNISGNLTARASVGPGTLEGVKAHVEFDPEDESATKVSGSARFVVPAEAGLKLGISGALGAGIPIVSATAGLEISGELGVKGEASASANLDWTPQEGLNITADVGVEASPKFTFAITGFVNVSADLVLTEVELYKKTWNLASVEFGSDMTVGAHLPVKVEHGELKDISTDDVKFTVPDVNPLDVAKGLIDKIA